MFNNQKIKVYLILFLLFSVASSKAIIIYNEETVVALSFLTFVIFSFNYFGNLVKESLDERSSLIRGSLENFHRLKEESLQELLLQHKQIKQLKKTFPSVGSFTQKQLSYSSASASKITNLHNQFCFSVQQKLSYFQSSKSLLQQGLQKSIALTIPTIVVTKIKYNKQNKKLSFSSQRISNRVKQSLKLLKS